MASPLTTEEKRTLAAYDEHGKIWAAASHQRTWWSEELQQLKRHLPSGKVLEIGAGSGRDALALASFGYDYVGTDISEGMLATARANAPQLTFLRQSVYELDFPQHSFDGFWCCATLLHVPKDRIDEALQRIKLVVTPGGIGFVSIKPGSGERVTTDDYSGHSIHRFYAFYSLSEFHAILERNGFEVIEEREKVINEKRSYLVFFVRV